MRRPLTSRWRHGCQRARSGRWQTDFFNAGGFDHVADILREASCRFPLAKKLLHVALVHVEAGWANDDDDDDDDDGHDDDRDKLTQACESIELWLV